MKDGPRVGTQGGRGLPRTSLWSLQMASVLSEVCLSAFAAHSVCGLRCPGGLALRRRHGRVAGIKSTCTVQFHQSRTLQQKLAFLFLRPHRNSGFPALVVRYQLHQDLPVRSDDFQVFL